MWKDIIKNQKLISSPKIKTKLKKIPESNTKKDCNNKLEEYYDKLSSHGGYLFNLGAHSDTRWKRVEHKDDKYTERIIAKYELIPEKVACKALDYLEREGQNNIQYRTIKDGDDNWKIGWRVDKLWNEYGLPDDDFNGMGDAGVLLVIYKDGDTEEKVYLSHRIILYREFDEKFENKCIKEIDWR